MEKLEKETIQPDFWKNTEKASEISQRLADLKEETEKIKKFKKGIEDLKELESLAEEDKKILEEIEKRRSNLEKEVKEEEFKVYLGGKYDKRDVILQIVAGAGGIDAEDWVTMLQRMYQRYCERKGWGINVLDKSFGEGGGPKGRIGTKSVTLEIRGGYVFGLLKRESGIHRIVRISPFSAKSLRHTSFASVEVLPKMGKIDKEEIEVKSEDLRIDTFRASGPGGQYVNKRESAIRITHLPTKTTVSCQSERLQGENKRKAMEVLYSKLYQLKKKKKEKELEKIKGKEVSVSWGNQIRSYVLHPYQQVKDQRTEVETSRVDDVLDGDLDKFIKAEIKLNSNQENLND